MRTAPSRSAAASCSADAWSSRRDRRDEKRKTATRSAGRSGARPSTTTSLRRARRSGRRQRHHVAWASRWTSTRSGARRVPGRPPPHAGHSTALLRRFYSASQSRACCRDRHARAVVRHRTSPPSTWAGACRAAGVSRICATASSRRSRPPPQLRARVGACEDRLSRFSNRAAKGVVV